MTKINLGIVCAIVLASIVVPAAIQHQSSVRLRAENESLRQQLVQLPRLSAENQRLSNIVAQAKVALTSADDRYQELLRLRAEVNRLNQENQGSNRVDQAKMAQIASEQLRELSTLRSEVTGLSKEISKLRDDIRQVPAVASTPAPVEKPAEKPVAQAASAEGQPLSIRMIDTQGDTFAEKLKRSVAAQENETFQEVFGRFLQVNGIDISNVAGFGYNESTGRVVVRAPQATLDQIEKVTVALDRAP